MPIFEFTSPDGKTYEVTGPEGATEEQAFQMLQQQIAAQPTVQTSKDAQMVPDTHSGSIPSLAPAPFASVQPESAPAPQRSFGEDLLRQAGLTARAGISGVTGLSGAIADVPFAVARAMGANVPLPSSEQQALMTRMGLPEPEGTVENIAQLGGAMLAGGRADPLIAKFAPMVQAKPFTTKQQATKKAIESGYKLSPSQADKSRGLLYAAERASSKPLVEEELRKANQARTTELVRKALHLPKDTPVTKEVLDNLKSAVYEEGYAPIDKLGKISVGRVYREALDNITEKYAGAASSFPKAVKQEVKELVDGYRVRQFDAADARLAIKTLREDATVTFKNNKPQLAKANNAIAKELERAIEAHLKLKGPEFKNVLSNFRDARTEFAKIYEVEKVLSKPDTPDAIKLAQRLAKGVPLTDELATVARFGQQFPLVARPPAGTMPQPFGLTKGMVEMVTQAAPRKMLLSPWVQRKLIPTQRYEGMGPLARSIGGMYSQIAPE